MKTIGMIGGMSWESTVEYYRIINEAVKARLGGLHSARTLLYSVDFADVEVLQREGRWEEATRMMVDIACSLERGGAELIVICTNTMHKMADEVQAAVRVPLLHIADATADAVKARGIHKVGLLGTRFTMEQEFYKGRLENKHNLAVVTPSPVDRELVHRVIYDELCLGIAKDGSRREYTRIMDDLARQGAQGIILGCTEIGLLVKPEDSHLPLFDTTYIHALAAADFAMKG